MKALFGTVSVLVALAVAALVTMHQLGAGGRAPAATSSASSSAVAGNVAQRARGLERQVADDVARALQQGAAARADAPESP